MIMTDEKAITLLSTFKENCYNDEIKKAIDVAIQSIQLKELISIKVDEINELITQESLIIERLPKDKDFHLAVRRGLILAKQVMTENEWLKTELNIKDKTEEKEEKRGDN